MKKQRKKGESADETDFSELGLHLPQGTTTTCGNQNEGKMDSFHKCLIEQQCLCDVSEGVLRKAFEGYQVSDENGTRTPTLCEWPPVNILQFLSNLQLLFEVYLEQNNRGKICARIAEIRDILVINEHCLVEQIISLCDLQNADVNYVSARVLSSFFLIAKKHMNEEWLERVVRFLSAENGDLVKMNFALDVIKWVVEWKDVEVDDLDDDDEEQLAGTSNQTSQGEIRFCNTVQYDDPELYDTSAIKKLIIDSLKAKWLDLIEKIKNLIARNDNIQSHQTCILTFLSLWKSTISVKTNLSVYDTKPFYAHLETFVGLLHSAPLPPIIWKQLLSLFNEALCYGSTLALQDQDTLNDDHDDTCRVATEVVRCVKNSRLLDSLPYRCNNHFTVNRFVGTVQHPNIDKTLLQRMVLLVLKSVAVTIKGTRSDSSDSSLSSDENNCNQDMQLIERSIRVVFKKLDVFIKNSMDYHPETPFSKVLVHLFSDHAVYMIEAMVCTLDITVGISYHNSVYPDLLAMLNPVHSFIEFLKIVSHDARVLLAYLKDNRTCFLLYLLRFLKYITKNWQKFVYSCYENSGARTNDLDNTMTVLIRLKMEISNVVVVKKYWYPYIKPVLKLLETCESLYEGNEYS